MTTIERVHVVFKTHLDIGFTHLAAHVARQYREEYIPKAMELAERLEAAGGPERFVWTTGSWLIWHYLNEASAEEARRMERAIAKGHIVWHGLPVTTHTELMDPELFRFGLSIARELDERFGKKTIAAKMTDVPGHTLGMVPLMRDAGLTYLHLGVNPASARPDVPRLFRWQTDDGAEILVNYAGTYGEALEIDGLKDALVFAHTGDNCGPPSAEEIREQFREIGARYPGAQILASTMDAFAERLASVRERLPVVREEIGDTWIHGGGTDPRKLARYRELLRLRNEWLAAGRMDRAGAEYKRMSEALLLVAEHTWGLDIKKWLPDFRHYAKADFAAARQRDVIDPHDVPAKFGYIGAFAMDEFDRHSSSLFAAEQSVRSYAMAERSWAEQRAYVDQAVAALEPVKRAEALAALQKLEPQRTDADGGGVAVKGEAGSEEAGPGLGQAGSGGAFVRLYETHRGGGFELAFAQDGSLIRLTDGNGKNWADEAHPFGAYVYETFGTEDYGRYFRTYMQNLTRTHPWADADFSKPGFEFVRPLPSHRTFRPIVRDIRFFAGGATDRYLVRLRMPEAACEDGGAPRELELAYVVDPAEGEIGVTLQWFGKDANRLPEASWLSCGLAVDNPNLWTMDKLGRAVSPLAVVRDGNRNLHAVTAAFGIAARTARRSFWRWTPRWSRRDRDGCFSSTTPSFRWTAGFISTCTTTFGARISRCGTARMRAFASVCG